MPYEAARTPTLIASLQKEPGREFRASDLQKRTTVPKKYVRRALTVDAEKEAKIPTDGVTMVKRGGLWWFSWSGARAPQPPEPN